MKTFTKNDWNHLHDTILTATWNTVKKKCNQQELEEFYEALPTHLKYLAIEWGMNDTKFREGVIEHYFECVKELNK